VGWLAASRILYEGLFPRWLWLGQPFLTLTFTAFTTLLTWLLWLRWGQKKISPVLLLPLLLNFIYLADPIVNLGRSRFIFGATLWLLLLFYCGQRFRDQTWRWLGPLLIGIALLPVYLTTMSRTVGQADTFEFQVVAPQLGIAHPTGYPLYLLLGKLFTLFPFGSVAWRINVGTTVLTITALIFFYKLLWYVWGLPETAVLAAVVMGLTVTLWSQAIAAEVYALHALVVCVSLWLMVRVGEWASGQVGKYASGQVKTSSPLRSLRFLRLNLFLLAAVIGLGLTNHLTTVFLLPPAALTIILILFPRKNRSDPLNIDHRSLITDYRFLLPLLLVFLLPLLLYLYLPLRWQAVNGEPMGAARFVDWVVGGRFQGALQWRAWLNDPGRYAIVGRLLAQNWGGFNLVVALFGAIYLARRQWRLTAVFALTFLGFTFYNLNYYVPDLAVFLIPAQLVLGLFWASGVTAVLHTISHRLSKENKPLLPIIQTGILLLLLLPMLMLAVNNRAQLDNAADDGRTAWGMGVLRQPLTANAAILADSDKFPPLFYLQQAEGMRPDLDIMVLPDEAAYRAELDARLAAGESVYLARFLPGLAGIYHLRAAGPLTEVSLQPLQERPSSATPVNLNFGGMRLIGVAIESEAAIDPLATAVTLYWQTDAPLNETQHIFVRWTGENVVGQPDVAAGQHAVHNNYPTVAWRSGEIVVDYHSWPRPILADGQTLQLQVAVAPPFTPADQLLWQDVAAHDFEPAPARELAQPLRAQVGSVLLTTTDFATQMRPNMLLPILLAGVGAPADIQISLQTEALPLPLPILRPETAVSPNNSFTHLQNVTTPLENGRYQLIAQHPSGEAQCGWMSPVTRFCVLGEVLVDGVPLPVGATNFEDKIGLLDITLPSKQLQPGALLDVSLTWQALTPLQNDFTVFIQVLDANDQIVGQIDSWPVQGTFPTSQWPIGEQIEDSYQVQLDSDLPPGPYRVQVGLYLLQTLRRLSVLDDAGTAVDDKLLLTGLTVTE
ncbi:MAG: DUF2723 domain-containing protein, partial [Chloroflexi bacterium]|nr:DUF2723 domain-containing protein [Chloroflexota bacterium]